MWKEFKEFAFRGNVVELAVAVVLGIAFGMVIASLVNDVLMNLIAAVIGQPDFSQLTVTLNDAVIRYGAFINALINFLLVALALFFVIKAVNRATRKPAAEEPTVRECPRCMTSIPARASRCSACTSEVQPQTAA
jgi:large conductance mechanosensitive channel